MFYKISDRVEEEYGYEDEGTIVDSMEPMAIISLIALIGIMIYAVFTT
jgi:hypothetical protein